jgi:ParB family chromosome partitioning protein
MALSAAAEPSTIRAVPLPAISVENRQRALQPEVVEELAASIPTVGLLQPIVVEEREGGFTLVDGRHRLEAARRLGWADIPAVVRGPDEIDRELAELDANLMRAELSPLEKGEHLVRRDQILRARGQRATGGRPTKGDKMAGFFTTQDLGREAGMSARQVQRYTAVGRGLSQEARDVLRGTPGAWNLSELEALARIPEPRAQLHAARRLVQGTPVALSRAMLEAKERLESAERVRVQLDAGASTQLAPPRVPDRELWVVCAHCRRVIDTAAPDAPPVQHCDCARHSPGAAVCGECAPVIADAGSADERTEDKRAALDAIHAAAEHVQRLGAATLRETARCQGPAYLARLRHDARMLGTLAAQLRRRQP